MDGRRGIELAKSDRSSGVSIVIGDTTLKPQGRPTSVRFEKQVACVYLVVDTSGSMAGGKLEQAKDGIIDFAIDAFRKEYSVGLISFNTTAKHICEPTYEVRLLKDRIREMHSMGTTNMAEAIKMAHDCLRPLAGTRVIVIATDGVPDSVDNALREGAKAKRDKIDIITIGTDDADLEFLRKLATRAELGKKVTREVFSRAISDTSRLLPSPKSIIKR